MRILVIDEHTDLEALTSRLLDRRVASDKAESALQSLRELNPHVDLQKLAPDTVLLVPDTPSFKASASASAASPALDDFQALVREALQAGAAKLKAANEARAAENIEVATALKSSAVKRIIETDAELKQQLDEAVRSYKEDQQQGTRAERALDEATKAALAELASLARLLG